MRVIVAGAGVGGLTAELTAFDQAYRSTTLPDVAALYSRPSLTP